MEKNIEICPKCGQLKGINANFCIECGHKYTQTHTPKFPYSRSVLDSIRKQASSARTKTSDLINPEKASQAVQNMVDVVTIVAQDLKQGMSSEMVKAVTVSARISFVAFSIGVNIALDKLPLRTQSTSIND